MNEFINEFGKDNFIIIIAVVIAIVLALIIIILIERFQTNRRRKKEIQKEISNYRNNPSNYERKDYQPLPLKEENEEKETDILEEVESEEVVYVEETNKEEAAKEKLEEVTKKLIEEQDDGLIEHTNFENEQEEKSIISYDELVKASHDINEKNDLLLEDEGEEPITLEELYQKHVDSQNVLEDDSKEVKVNNPIFEDTQEKKFKNSEVISPVFGFYSGKVKQEVNEKEPEELFEDYSNKNDMKDLEVEIQKTEEFLSELKRLKNKLD